MTPEEALAAIAAEQERRGRDGDGSASAAKPAAQPSAKRGGVAKRGGIAENIVSSLGMRSLNQGLLLGLGDEYQAAVNATGDLLKGDGSWRQNYGRHLENERTALESERAERPVRSLVTEMAGAVPGAVMSAPAAISRFAAPAGRMAANAMVGAGAGGVYGFNQGEEGVDNRLRSALLPAVVGGAVGAASPIPGAVAGKIASERARRKAAEAGNVPKATVDELRNVFSIDGGLGAKQLDLTPDGMYADAGPAARGALDLAIRESGGATPDLVSLSADDSMLRQLFSPTKVDVGSEVHRRIDDRAASASRDIRNALDGAFGKPKGVEALKDELFMSDDPTAVLLGQKSHFPGAEPGSPVSKAYGRAYRGIIDYASPEGQRLEKVLKTQIPGDALGYARKLMKLQGIKSRQTLIKDLGNGKYELSRLPDVREADYIARGLQEAAERTTGTNRPGRKTSVGVAYEKVNREIKDIVRTMVPEYDEALTMAHRNLAAGSALDLGKKAIRTIAMPVDEFNALTKKMDAEQKQYLAQGIREGIDEMMAKVKDSLVPSPTVAGYVSRQATADPEGTNVLKHLSSRNMREKVASVLGKTETDRLLERLERTASALELKGTSAMNVRKAAQAARNRRLADRDAELVERLTRGEITGAVGEIGGRFLGKGHRRGVQRFHKADAELAEVLTRRTDGQKIADFMNATPPAVAERNARHLAEVIATRTPMAIAPVIDRRRPNKGAR